MAILYFLGHLGPTILHKKFQIIWIKNEGVMAFFVISHFHNFQEFKKTIGMCGYLWVCFGMYGYVLEFNVSKRLSFGAGSLNSDPSACIIKFEKI